MAKCDECGTGLGILSPKKTHHTAKKTYIFCADSGCDVSWRSKNDPSFSDKDREESKERYEADKQKNLALENMLFVSDNVLTGARTVKTLGTARGATVRAKHVGRDIAAGLKNFVGGEIKGYTELLAEGREEAIQRMKEDALRMGANAIIMTRFSTSMIEPGAVEVMAYGTAIVSESRGEEDV